MKYFFKKYTKSIAASLASLIVVEGSVAIAFPSERPEWRYVEMVSGKILSFPRATGNFYESYMLPGANSVNRFGPISVWQDSSNGVLHQVSGSLVGLDLALRAQIGAEPTKVEIERSILQGLRMYRGIERVQFLNAKNQLYAFDIFRRSASPVQCERITQAYSRPSFRYSEYSWEISTVVVTYNGGVEAWQLSGEIVPFSVTNESTTMICMAGTIKQEDLKRLSSLPVEE